MRKANTAKMMDSTIRKDPIDVVDGKNAQASWTDAESHSAASKEGSEFQNNKPVGKWTRWYRSPLFK